MKSLRSWCILPAAVKLLLITQMLFNIGFYLVIPFLSHYMSDSLAASAATVGFVLGLRTFSQQGMFFVGGALADSWGIRPTLLTGIIIRIAGFALAGVSNSLTTLIIAVILIGFGAALFSPAMDTALAIYGTQLRGITRQELFAMDSVFSRIGELLGPVLGSLLIPFGFSTVAGVGAGIFSIIFVLHILITPALHAPDKQPVAQGFHQVLTNRQFILFACAYGIYLVGYNQLYQGLPVEIERVSGSQSALGLMFIIASVFSVLAQMPLTQLAQKLGVVRALGWGYGIQAAAFFWVAAAGAWSSLAVAVLFVLVLSIGQMIAIPVARDTVAILAGEDRLGTYFGVLNSFGGLAVLIAASALGPLFADPANPHPWLILTALLGGAGLLATGVARRLA